MGASLHIRFSFYFELKDEIKEVISTTKYRCANKKCPMHNRASDKKEGNFCQSCGTKIEQFSQQGTETFPDLYDFCSKHLGHGDFVTLLYGIYDDVTNEETDRFWGWNKKIESLENFKLKDISYGGIFDLTNFNVKELLDEFKNDEDVKKFLHVFDKEYGLELMDIKLGIHSLYS